MHKLYANVPQLFRLLDKLESSEIELKMKVWTDFYSAYLQLKSAGGKGDSVNSNNILSIKEANKAWLNLFLRAYHSKFVTPYMHLLVVHAHEIIQRYGSLNAFSCQGLEKLDHDMTVDYFRGTNHHLGVKALSQLMRKYNRALWFQCSSLLKCT